MTDTNDVTTYTTMDVLDRSRKGAIIREIPAPAALIPGRVECIFCSENIHRSVADRTCSDCAKLLDALMAASDCEIYTHASLCDGTCGMTCRPRDWRKMPYFTELVPLHKQMFNPGANVLRVESIDQKRAQSQADNTGAYDITVTQVADPVPVWYTGDPANYVACMFIHNELLMAAARGIVLGRARLGLLLEAAGMGMPDGTIKDMIALIRAHWKNQATADDAIEPFAPAVINFLQTHRTMLSDHFDVSGLTLDACLAYIEETTGEKPGEMSKRAIARAAREARTTARDSRRKMSILRTARPVVRYGQAMIGWISAKKPLGKVCDCGSVACKHDTKACGREGYKQARTKFV